MISSHCFVTSTGTDVGKTLVSGWLLRALEEEGSIGYYKPVASGCEEGPWGYRSPDETELLRRTSLEPEAVRSGLRFEAPLSPDKAAEKEERTIDLEPVLTEWSRMKEQYDRVIVEGIGGVAVPFGPEQDVADLIRTMDLPVILVVSSGLGTISHTRTAVEYLDRRDCSPVGIILTPDEGDPIQSLNRDHLREFYPEKPVSLFPHEDCCSYDELLTQAAEFLDRIGLRHP